MIHLNIQLNNLTGFLTRKTMNALLDFIPYLTSQNPMAVFRNPNQVVLTVLTCPRKSGQLKRYL